MTNLFSPAITNPTTSRIEYLEVDPKFIKHEKPKKIPAYLPIIQIFIGFFGRLFPGITAKIASKLLITPRKKAKHRISDKILESAQISEMIVGANILKIYEWGEGDKTVLMIHGWESRGTAMRSFVKPLIEKGYRVIAFDGPAHGNSTGKRTHIPEFSEAIAAIIKREKSVVAIITHSFGGVCVTYASRKLIPKISIPKVVMIAVPMAFDDILKKVFRIMNFPPGVVKRLNQHIVDLSGESAKALSISNASEKTGIKELLVIHDKKDPIVSFKYAKQIIGSWKNSKLIITEGLGHFRIMKNEKVILKVRDFILS